MTIDNLDIAKLNVGNFAVGKRVKGKNIAGQTFPEKPFGFCYLKKKHVIVEINKLLRKTGNPMKVDLYRMTAEQGEILLQEKIFMADDI